MYRVYAGSRSFNKICTRKKKVATTQHTPSCLKKHVFMSSCLKNVFLSKKRLLVHMQISYKE